MRNCVVIFTKLLALLQNIAGMTVPHQTAADGAQYVVSAKATTKDVHLVDSDISKKDGQQVQVASYSLL